MDIIKEFEKENKKINEGIKEKYHILSPQKESKILKLEDFAYECMINNRKIVYLSIGLLSFDLIQYNVKDELYFHFDNIICTKSIGEKSRYLLYDIKNHKAKLKNKIEESDYCCYISENLPYHVKLIDHQYSYKIKTIMMHHHSITKEDLLRCKKHYGIFKHKKLNLILNLMNI